MSGLRQGNLSRRGFMRGAAIAAGLAGLPFGARAAEDDQLFVRLATGPASGTYFSFGGLLATAVSNPPGTRECQLGGICGVPGLIAIAHSSEGSVSNVHDLAANRVESGLCQADVAHWAGSGKGAFSGSGLEGKIKSITSLYDEVIHVVAGAGRGIWGISDLAGRRVSIDLPGSGTNLEARMVLRAHGLKPEDLDLFELAPGEAADRLAADEIDGFFLVSGTPANAIRQLAEDYLITLLPITGEGADQLRNENSFLTNASIAAGTYFNVPFIRTLSVRAMWLASAELSEDLVYNMTEAFWDPRIQDLIGQGHSQGEEVDAQAALTGTAETPLHRGAQRYYHEHGLALINPPRLG